MCKMSVGHEGIYGGYHIKVIEVLPGGKVKIVFVKTGYEKIVYKSTVLHNLQYR